MLKLLRVGISGASYLPPSKGGERACANNAYPKQFERARLWERAGTSIAALCQWSKSITKIMLLINGMKYQRFILIVPQKEN